MTMTTTVAHSPQYEFSTLSPIKGIAGQTSRITATSILAKVSASGLVIASAGFGCLYAYQTNIGHGTTLAALAVTFAAALELAKPLAVASAANAFRHWRIGQGLALAALAITAVAYSLTAETSLMARSRADTIAERAGTSQTATDARAKVKSLSEEIAALMPSKAVSEIEPLIASLKSRLPRGTDCAGWTDGKKTRDKCIDIAGLASELGRAQHRAELANRLADAELAVSIGPVTKIADPGAVALSTWLAALGVSITPERLADWMVLVGILALEIGSALAGVLVAATTPDQPSAKPTAGQIAATNAVADHAKSEGMTAAKTGPVTAATAVVTASNDGVSLDLAADGVTAHATVPTEPVVASSRTEAARRLLALLRDSGGTVDASRHTIGRMIAATPSTAYAALTMLSDDGRVTIATSTRGTVVKLAA